MKQKCVLAVILFCLGFNLQSQDLETIPLPENLVQGYPRLYITQDEKTDLEKTIQDEKWAQDVLAGIHKRIDKYVILHVDSSTWMPSRLQMYWKTKSTDVYVEGIYYSHAEGEAPVPTVRFTGSRDYTTNYSTPKLEEVLPYMDDPRGLYLPNKTRGGQFEWAQPSKTGGIIHRLNQKIIGLARDAAFIYWLEGDERYAKFSYDVFKTYMDGMYYRNEPIDLLHGHIQTLVGLSCFQVIHESTLKDASELYDFLHPYIESKHASSITNYDVTIKKWADLVIKNGVPQNNWNLHQANIILKAAMVLQDNANYEDNKGREYYINHILNVSSPRQWSMTKLMDYGYDTSNGVWAECPGYSQGVTKELMSFILDFDNTFDHNILPYTSVMDKAVKMLPQYLFPNGQIVAFGDTYYGHLYTEPIGDMVRLAQKYGDTKMEEEFTAMYRLFEPNADKPAKNSKPRSDVSSFFAAKPLLVNKDYAKGTLSDYMSQTFYAPNVSWHVQRMGEGKDGMMLSLNGSLGNHMHANGINMELYGKGFVQGADPGKGAGYLQPIYLEYYSQFPAHNTVMVDGVSSYTEMLSYHGFDLKAAYPQSEQKEGFYPSITFSDVYFLEPETQSDQNRTVSIVKTGETTGYYVDVFRSKKQKGGDKFHDYYYHNLGQSMVLTDVNEKALDVKPSGEMGFAGGHLYALDYMWDKKSVHTNEDYVAEWKIDRPEGEEDVFMNLWMKGTEGREVFTVKSPSCKSFKDKTGIPYDIDHDPYLTLVARQHGEAWEHPYISVYQPYTSTEGKSIKSIEGLEDENGNKDFAGLHVTHKSGRVDFIFASYEGNMASAAGISTNATYANIVEESNGNQVWFMGNGTSLTTDDLSMTSNAVGNAVVEQKDGAFYLHNEVEVIIKIGKKKNVFAPGEMRAITLK